MTTCATQDLSFQIVVPQAVLPGILENTLVCLLQLVLRPNTEGASFGCKLHFFGEVVRRLNIIKVNALTFFLSPLHFNIICSTFFGYALCIYILLLEDHLILFPFRFTV